MPAKPVSTNPNRVNKRSGKYKTYGHLSLLRLYLSNVFWRFTSKFKFWMYYWTHPWSIMAKIVTFPGVGIYLGIFSANQCLFCFAWFNRYFKFFSWIHENITFSKERLIFWSEELIVFTAVFGTWPDQKGRRGRRGSDGRSRLSLLFAWRRL